MVSALLAHAQGDIQKHKMNVEVYLSNPVGIGEHSNVMEAIEEELNMIAKYEDQITVIKKHFSKGSNETVRRRNCLYLQDVGQSRC